MKFREISDKFPGCAFDSVSGIFEIARENSNLMAAGDTESARNGADEEKCLT